MNNPTSQILLILNIILAGIITIVLFAVRHANRETPGLRAWAYSYLCGLLLSFAYLVRPYLPEGLSVIATQALTFAWAWLNLAAARAYTGRRPWSLAYPAWALVIVLGLSLYWTWWLPELKLRIILVCVTNGTLLLLSATTMLTADIRRQPERYLFTLACGGQGLLRLANALILGQTDLPDPERLGVITQVVLFESIVALVMHVFGVLMLANGHITAELRHFAERDPLTSVFNRRTFLILLDKSVNLMRRMNSPLSLLALDLDHFKRINDTWGHGGGDQALRHFVQLATDQLRTLIAAQPVAGAPSPIALTVSLGVTLIARGESQEAALQRVDEAMYRAKAKSRNRVELA